MIEYSPDIELLKKNFSYFGTGFIDFNPAIYYHDIDLLKEPFLIERKIYEALIKMSAEYKVDINGLAWIVDRFIVPQEIIQEVDNIYSHKKIRELKKLYDSFQSKNIIEIHIYEGKKNVTIDDNLSRLVIGDWIRKKSYLDSELLNQKLATRNYPKAQNQYLLFLVESIDRFYSIPPDKGEEPLDKEKEFPLSINRRRYFLIGKLFYLKGWHFKDREGNILNNPENIISSSLEDKIKAILKIKKY